MRHRFRFLASYEASSHLWYIDGEEYFHTKKVLRLDPGALIEVFDGRGSWGEGIIMEMQKDRACIRVPTTHQEPPPQPKLVLALGALQPQTMAELVPCLVELGIDELHVLLPSGVAKARLNEKLQGRWHKIAIAAAKQSKRAWLPPIRSWPSLAKFLALAQSDFDERWLLNPNGAQPLLEKKLAGKKSTCLLIGSEKGFTSAELDLIHAADFQSVHLGRCTLRSFTAAVVAVALISTKRSALIEEG